MYRARAEIVSGTRVYADGKWLRCIGNKNVSVGEYVWTDGRCVYGHFQESQQPQVITAQEETEGIPILLGATLNTDGGYSVHKTPYYTYDSKLRPLEPPEKLGFTGSEMINAYKRDAYLISYDGASTFYAGNIDKSGHVYKLIGASTKITIYKDGEEISVTDLSDLLAQQRAEAINSIPSGTGKANSSSPTASCTRYGQFAVIENENNWNVLLFLVSNASQMLIGDDMDCSYNVYQNVAGEETMWHYTVERTHHATGIAESLAITAYLVNQDGWREINNIRGSYSRFEYQQEEIYDHYYGYYSIRTKYNRTVVLSEEIHDGNLGHLQSTKDVKFHLQDGFYFTIDDYPNFPTDMFCFPLFMKISIYTKEDKLLLTETFKTRSRITIGKAKSRYLIAVRHFDERKGSIFDFTTLTTASSDNEKYETYATGTSYIDAGLYLFDGETLKKIADGTCFNARFRAMTKYKNWQKRIQKL